MADNISLAVLHSSDAKSEIVKVLASSWPLNARRIFQKMKDAGGREISYQGVHKAVRQLEVAGVLKKEEKGYALDAGWLAQAKKFVDHAEAKYSGNPALSFGDIAEGSSASLSFSCYWTGLMYVLYEMKKVFEARGKKHDVVAVYFFHPWPLTALSKPDFEKLIGVMNVGEHYAICPNTNPRDLVLLELWKKIKTGLRASPGVLRECESITVYEYLVQIYLSKKLKEKLDAFYEKKGALDADALAELYKIVFDDSGKTDVVVIRNKEIANGARESVLSHFGKKLVEKKGVVRAV